MSPRPRSGGAPAPGATPPANGAAGPGPISPLLLPAARAGHTAARSPGASVPPPQSPAQATLCAQPLQPRGHSPDGASAARSPDGTAAAHRPTDPAAAHDPDAVGTADAASRDPPGMRRRGPLADVRGKGVWAWEGAGRGGQGRGRRRMCGAVGVAAVGHGVWSRRGAARELGSPQNGQNLVGTGPSGVTAESRCHHLFANVNC